MWPGDFEVVALDGLDLAAHPGELVAVMGRPGPESGGTGESADPGSALREGSRPGLASARDPAYGAPNGLR